MNILYIIGNGLDISLNLKTSYQDFFRYYLKVASDDEDILAMKKDINSHRYETWADLEIGMGVYSSQCADKSVFLKCLGDIKSNLREYLKKESEKVEHYKLSSYLEFGNPGLLLDPEPKSRFDLRHRKANIALIDVLTLNYTPTMETLLGFNDAALNITYNAQLHSIHHLHGTLYGNMMVMGVNDSNQISNLGFNTDIDVMEEFVKPEYNDACLNNMNGIGEKLILDADIIVLYGTSLGLSDDKWWKLIGKRMQSANFPLLVFLPYDEKKNPSLEPNRLRRWTLGYVNEIREKFDVKVDEKVLAQRVCVALNKRLFQIHKLPRNLVK